MSERVQYGSFTIEREFSASAEQVFLAWSDPKAKARWFGWPGEWETLPLKLDFRVGGEETVSGGPAGGVKHSYRARYEDIVPGVRIVYTYDMQLGGRRISVSLACVEFLPAGQGSRMVFTEQVAFFEHADGVKIRREGMEALFNNLARALAS